MKLGIGSFLPRSFYSPPRISISWKKLWWIPFWITTSSAFSLPPAKLKGYTYHPQRSHTQLSLPTVNSFFLRTVDGIMAPSPRTRATRTSTRSSSSSSSTPLDDQEVTKKEVKKRKAASPKAASPKAASPVKEKVKSPSKVKGKVKQAPDNTDTDISTAVPESTAKKAKKTSAPKHQILTERDEIPKLWDSDMAKQNGSYSKSCTVQITHRRVTVSLPLVSY
jgi:hypothetical protein